MSAELEVLRIISERLGGRGIEFMLTGSFALAYYATPRMTRDLDVVIALVAQDMPPLVEALVPDFYIDEDAAREALKAETLFNIMHLESGVKVDLIIRKHTEYRQLEFGRRRAVDLAGVRTWIVSREDLILSKLVWARDTGSELQRRDVRSLLAEAVDRPYLRRWAEKLDVAALLEQSYRE